MSKRVVIPSVDPLNIHANPAQWRLGCALVDEAVRAFGLFSSSGLELEEIAAATEPHLAMAACGRAGQHAHVIKLAAYTAQAPFINDCPSHEEYFRRIGETDGLNYLIARADYVSRAYLAAMYLCLAASKLEREESDARTARSYAAAGIAA